MKTLLVGLGGTGCEIVANVKNLIGTSDPDVQFVGFDTDGNWEGTEGLPVCYTSREMSVKDYLDDMNNWQEWFPDNSLLKARNMVKGAGQVRLLSRLAFAETTKAGRIGKLENAIRQLQIARGDVNPTNLRVMIISSFAGGTGSGMFIQAALFIRKYLMENYGCTAIVRGLFALPDLFMSINASPKQRESMYANAYAALKELNALNSICLSQDAKNDDITMKIDGLFDSKKDRGNAAKKPYDFIFFVDNINSRGRVLSSLKDYKQLLTTATYMQVYSPITDMGDSREDNAILTIISGDGKPLYGSVGASRIVYPYRDMVDYCGMRATTEAIGEVWTLVDKRFAKENAENKRMMAIDPTVKELDRNKHFIAAVEGLIEDGNARFLFLKSAITDTDEDGRENERADYFFDVIKDYIDKKIKDDKEIVEKEAETSVTEKQLKANTQRTVYACETALKEYLDTINSRVMLLRNSVVQAIIPDTMDSTSNLDADWNIMNLISKQKQVAHPLAVRMLLYKLREKILEEYKANSDTATSSFKKVTDYFKKAYDIPTTPVTETAEMRAAQKGWGKASQFRTLYLIKSKEQKTNLDSYRNNKFSMIVFKDVLERLDAIIKQYERLFDSLDSITDDLNRDIENIEAFKHSNTAEATIYVGSSVEEKRDLFDSLNFTCSDRESNEVYGHIFNALYAEAMQAVDAARKNQRKKISKADEETERNRTMGSIFRENIVAMNIADIEKSCSDQLDRNVYDVMHSAEENHYLRSLSDVIASTFDKALPFLQHNLSRKLTNVLQAGGDENNAYTLTFWGINPEVYSQVAKYYGQNSVASFFKTGSDDITPEVVSNNEYSKYEISCYQALYCVTLSEIPKFSESGERFGIFYESYAKRIKELRTNPKTSITPHLDINWHKRSYLPMISAAKNLEDDKMTVRNMWLALIYGGIREETIEGQKVFYASYAVQKPKKLIPEEKYPKAEIIYKGNCIKANNYYELFKALQEDEVIVSRFGEVYEPEFAEDKFVGNSNIEFSGPRARKFAKMLASEDNKERNALHILTRFVTNSYAKESEKELFISELHKLMDEFCAELPNARKAKLREMIFKASKYSNPKTSRAGLERYINFEMWEKGVSEE